MGEQLRRKFNTPNLKGGEKPEVSSCKLFEAKIRRLECMIRRHQKLDWKDFHKTREDCCILKEFP